LARLSSFKLDGDEPQRINPRLARDENDISAVTPPPRVTATSATSAKAAVAAVSSRLSAIKQSVGAGLSVRSVPTSPSIATAAPIPSTDPLEGDTKRELIGRCCAAKTHLRRNENKRGQFLGSTRRA
jgi:hypothetical protein